MGSFEENYHSDTLHTFTQEERHELQALHERLDGRFREIASLLTKELGYDPTDPEVENVIDSWNEDVEIEGRKLDTPSELRRLLAEHARIAEDIVDIWDGTCGRKLCARCGLAVGCVRAVPA